MRTVYHNISKLQPGSKLMRATLGGAMDRVLGVSIGSHRHDPEREGGRNSDCE